MSDSLEDLDALFDQISAQNVEMVVTASAPPLTGCPGTGNCVGWGSGS